MAGASAKVAVAAGVVALGAAGWLGASVYTGRSVQALLADLAADDPAAKGLSFGQLRHETGLLASSGQVNVLWREACGAPGGRAAQQALEVSYEVSHLIGPDGLARFSWKAKPTGEAGAALARVFGQEARLSGEGKVTFGSVVQSSVSMPELVASLPASGSPQPGEVRLAAASGRLQFDRQALSIDLGSPRLLLQGAGQAVELKGIALDVDLSDRARGLGTLALSAEAFSAGRVSGEGLRLASSVAERGDRIDILFSPSVREVRAGEPIARQMDLEFGLRNLHAPSLRTLESLLTESCDLSELPEPSRARLGEAIRTLLAQGFSAGVSRLKGGLREGSVDGRLDIELKPSGPAPAAPDALGARLRASGELNLAGALLPAPQKQMLLSMGIATESGGGLKASFEYGDGVLRANGRTLDAALASGAIATLERGLASLTRLQPKRRDEEGREAGEQKADAPPTAGPGGVAVPVPGAKF